MRLSKVILFLSFIVVCACASSWQPPPAYVPPPNPGRVPAPGDTVKVYDADTLYTTAVHEAGHAIAIAAFHGVDIVYDIDIHVRTPDGSGHPHIGVVNNGRTVPTHPRDVRKHLIVSRIGIIAERMLTGSETGGGGDLENARTTAWMLYTHAPWRSRQGVHDRATAPRQVHEKVELEIAAADRCAEAMVRANEGLIRSLARLIVAQPTRGTVKIVDKELFRLFMTKQDIVTPSCAR